MAAKKKSTAARRKKSTSAASAQLIHVQLVGGEVKTYAIPAAGTLGALKAQLGLNKHQATINGEVEDSDSAMLVAGSLIVFTEKVKGA